MPSHRRWRAALTRPRRIGGWLRDFAFAKACTKDAASSEKRPPTSAANTTSCARPPSPESSGCVMVFLLRAEGQLRCGWPPCGVLCHLCAVGTPTSCLWPAGNRSTERLSATTSNLRLSSTLCSARSISRTYTLELTRAPASRQTCSAAFSKGNPRFPNTPASECVCFVVCGYMLLCLCVFVSVHVSYHCLCWRSDCVCKCFLCANLCGFACFACMRHGVCFVSGCVFLCVCMFTRSRVCVCVCLCVLCDESAHHTHTPASSMKVNAWICYMCNRQ